MRRLAATLRGREPDPEGMVCGAGVTGNSLKGKSQSLGMAGWEEHSASWYGEWWGIDGDLSMCVEQAVVGMVVSV